jgi:hypothetical protein
MPRRFVKRFSATWRWLRRSQGKETVEEFREVLLRALQEFWRPGRSKVERNSLESFRAERELQFLTKLTHLEDDVCISIPIVNPSCAWHRCPPSHLSVYTSLRLSLTAAQRPVRFLQQSRLLGNHRPHLTRTAFTGTDQRTPRESQ